MADNSTAHNFTKHKKPNKMNNAKFYVTMTDKFMSGWGVARNKSNKFIVECETIEQARIIERNAQRRNEMKYINLRTTRPKYGANVVESWTTFEELGEIWKR